MMASPDSAPNSYLAASSLDLLRVRDLLQACAHRFDVDHVAQCDSTNLQLIERAARGAGSGTVLVADMQTAGRGRRGRRWVSSPDASLTFSVLWRFPRTQRLEGLSLAAGLAIAGALQSMGCAGIALKWPNDIWLARRKLGGILVEVAQSPGDVAAVVGIGLNLRRAPAWQDEIDQPWAALEDAGVMVAREQVLAGILTHLLRVLEVFAQHGFTSLVHEWMQFHALYGASVRVLQHAQEIAGICGAVDELGRLSVTTDAGLVQVFSGEVSLRAAEGGASCAS